MKRWLGSALGAVIGVFLIVTVLTVGMVRLLALPALLFAGAYAALYWAGAV